MEIGDEVLLIFKFSLLSLIFLSIANSLQIPQTPIFSIINRDSIFLFY